MFNASAFNFIYLRSHILYGHVLIYSLNRVITRFVDTSQKCVPIYYLNLLITRYIVIFIELK